MANQRARVPGLSKAIETYLDAWEQFDEDQFAVEELHNALLTGTNTPEQVSSESALYGHLYQLAIAGLTSFYGDNTFSIRITPEHGEDRRRELAAEHIERLWPNVEEANEARIAEEGDAMHEDTETVTLDGEEYLRAFVGADTTLEKMQKFAWAALDHETHAGLVLQCGPAHVDSAQDLAARLCDEEDMSGSPCAYRFEERAERLEDDEGSKVFRLYLDEVRFRGEAAA